MHRIVAAAIWMLCLPAVAAAGQPLAASQQTSQQVAAQGGWKLADLADAMKALNDRSYSRGKRLFERAHCTTCHRQDNVGHEFGPDLTRLDPQFKPLDILRDILDPSRRIADAKYDVWVFETAAGHLVSGMVFRETDEFLKVMEKPAAVAPPLVLMKSEIESRAMSLTSMMPQGLVDTLTSDEIADLVAYVSARGDPTDPLVRSTARDSSAAGHDQDQVWPIVSEHIGPYPSRAGVSKIQQRRARRNPRCR